jgi:hypothetical protein
VAVAFFVAIRGLVSIYVGPIAGEVTPHFPLYITEGVLVELVALFVSTRRPLRFGLVSGLLIGTIGFAVALAVGSAPLLAAATVVIGGGQGVAFRAAVAAIGDEAPSDRLGATMSSFFVVVYVAISVPVVLAGAASARWGLRTSGLGFTAAVALLLVVALIATTTTSPSRSTAA